MLIVIAIAVSIVGTWTSLSRLAPLTGAVGLTGQANVSVGSFTAVNFTRDNITWGEGVVNDGDSFAVLNTSDGVVGGNWSQVAYGSGKGFLIRNNGNINVSLDLLSSTDAATMIGGGSPELMWNVSQNEAGSCTNSSYGWLEPQQEVDDSEWSLSEYQDVNTTSPGSRVCYVFPFNNDYDEIRVDVHMKIPSDSLKGELTAIFTATATAL